MKHAIVLSALCLATQAHISTAFAPIQQRHVATNAKSGVAFPHHQMKGSNNVVLSTNAKSGAAFPHHQMKGSNNVVLSMSDDGGSDNVSDESTMEVSAAPPSPPAASPVAETKTEVPLDVPSPILLAGSMVLAIVSTGSIFELLGGNPQFGTIPTALFAIAGTPLCFFLFYAAILKGNAETEADDERFMNNTKNSSSGFF